MASIFGARMMVHPSFVEPEAIITTAQPSGYMETLGGGALRVKLGPIDKFVYATRIDLRTAVHAQQAVHNALPSATILAQMLQTATYMFRTRAEYNEYDVAEAGEWNVSLPSAQRLAMRQGIFQALRMAALYGVNASNYEGLMNSPNATAVNLPPDTWGNTVIPTYDAGELALFFLGQVLQALTRMYMLGTAARVVFLGPQRVLGQMQIQNVVQLTSFQRAGAGSVTTAGEIETVLDAANIKCEWAYDDTLIGMGANGADAVLMVIPEIIVPSVDGINTNDFNKLSPSMRAATMQYADVAAPVEVTTPIVEGLDVTSSMRASSGWAPRGQAVTVLSLPY